MSLLQLLRRLLCCGSAARTCSSFLRRGRKGHLYRRKARKILERSSRPATGRAKVGGQTCFLTHVAVLEAISADVPGYRVCGVDAVFVHGCMCLDLDVFLVFFFRDKLIHV